MVEALANLQQVYEKWQSRNPYLRANNDPPSRPGGFGAGDGGAGSYLTGQQRSWQNYAGSSLRPPARRHAPKQRGRHRRENGLTDADELMVGPVCFLGLERYQASYPIRSIILSCRYQYLILIPVVHSEAFIL